MFWHNKSGLLKIKAQVYEPKVSKSSTMSRKRLFKKRIYQHSQNSSWRNNNSSNKKRKHVKKNQDQWLTSSFPLSFLWLLFLCFKCVCMVVSLSLMMTPLCYPFKGARVQIFKIVEAFIDLEGPSWFFAQ